MQRETLKENECEEEISPSCDLVARVACLFWVGCSPPQQNFYYPNADKTPPEQGGENWVKITLEIELDSLTLSAAVDKGF